LILYLRLSTRTGNLTVDICCDRCCCGLFSVQEQPIIELKRKEVKEMCTIQTALYNQIKQSKNIPPIDIPTLYDYAGGVPTITDARTFSCFVF
jgi:hypothetical protein